MAAQVILHDLGWPLQLPPLPEVPTTVRLCLAVAVGAEHPQVLQAVVVSDSVDMIDVDAERLS